MFFHFAGAWKPEFGRLGASPDLFWSYDSTLKVRKAAHLGSITDS